VTAFLTVIVTLAGMLLGWLIAIWMAWDPSFVAGPLIAGFALYRLLRRRGAVPRRATRLALASVATACLLAWAASEAFQVFSDAVGEYD
jgi:hypothetical protein